ncbi:entericidin A/B family lipoprotein [Azospirillum sp.]|jgi:entericidin B|nr:entericidin A/B family lipoprotein [Azospirillum sp.]HYD70847.1 entericidin A/B family lipoprotein [Azospirillum sp.]
MRIIKAFALLGIVGSLLAACNTFEGMGEDVQAGGRAMERSADSVQKKM